MKVSVMIPCFLWLLVNAMSSVNADVSNILENLLTEEDLKVKNCDPIVSQTKFLPIVNTAEHHSNRKLFPSDGECGIASPVIGPKKRIIGGKIVEQGQHPWFVSLVSSVVKDLGYCGGTIINERWVISAAHCYHGENKFLAAKIRVGEHDLRTRVDCSYEKKGPHGSIMKEVCNTYSDYEVEKIIPHPNFTKCMPTHNTADIHDIALFRTVEPIQFGRFVRPACLPWMDDPQEEYAGELADKLSVIGLGQTNSSSREFAQVLMVVKVPGVDMATCKEFYQFVEKGITICAGGQKDKDSCGGDSGGPILLTENGTTRTIGTVSYGASHCGEEGTPAVYGSVAAHLDWIVNNVY